MQGSNQPGKRIRKIRNRGIGKKERLRRIARLIERQIISAASDVPANAIPLNPDKVCWGYSGKPTKAFYVELNFVCKDCGLMQTWFKEDQMWFYEETGATFDKRAARCLECRIRERSRIEGAREASGHQQTKNRRSESRRNGD